MAAIEELNNERVLVVRYRFLENSTRSIRIENLPENRPLVHLIKRTNLLN
jgi:hypothetical protein